MPVLFSPDQVMPHDPAGFGRWLIGHYLEHKEFIMLANGLTPPTLIPDYALQSWSDEPVFVSGWLNVHANVHNALRVPANVTGIDLSNVDLTDDNQWYEWMLDHSQEHAALRAFYGVE